jgi:hypothetical protein
LLDVRLVLLGLITLTGLTTLVGVWLHRRGRGESFSTRDELLNIKSLVVKLSVLSIAATSTGIGLLVRQSIHWHDTIDGWGLRIGTIIAAPIIVLGCLLGIFLLIEDSFSDFSKIERRDALISIAGCVILLLVMALSGWTWLNAI